MLALQKNYKKFTILYVEDETIIRENVENCLKFVFNIIVAKDGEEGLNYFNTQKIDLVITDINMPVKDGISMLEDIKQIHPDIPCIVTSAYDLEIVNKLESISICQYMTKPFDIQELLYNSIKALNLK